MAAPNLATAYITILPSMKGAREKIAADLGDAGEKGGVAGGKNAEKGFVGGLKGISSKAAGIAAAASAVVGAGVVAGMTKAVMAASELEQSTGAIDAVYKENAQAMRDMASSAATNLGLTRDEFNQLGTVIGAQLKNGGTAMDELAPKAGELIGVGADLAAMFGGTTSDAVGALSSALKGERDPIERYGVSLNQAAIDAKAAELGFEKVGNSLSAEANQAATLALIMEQTADAHGAFGRESNTMAGQVERAKASFGNLVAELGTAFLPVVTEAVSLLNAHVIPVISGVVNGFGQWAAANPQLATTITMVVGGILVLIAIVGALMAVIGPIAFGIATVGAAFGALSLATLGPILAIGALIAALVGLVVAVVMNWEKIKAWWSDGMASIAQQAQDGWAAVSQRWSDGWNEVASYTQTKGQEVLDFIGAIPENVRRLFSDAGSWLVNSGRNIVQGLLDGAGQLLPQIGQFFLDKLPGWIREPFKAALGIRSPSRVFAGYGENIGEGLALGVESMGSRVRSSTSGLADSALSGAQALADGVGSVSTFQSASVAASNAPLYVPADWTERYGGQQQAAYANATEAVLDALSQVSVSLDGRSTIGGLTRHRAWPITNLRGTP